MTIQGRQMRERVCLCQGCYNSVLTIYNKGALRNKKVHKTWKIYTSQFNAKVHIFFSSLFSFLFFYIQLTYFSHERDGLFRKLTNSFQETLIYHSQ